MKPVHRGKGGWCRVPRVGVGTWERRGMDGGTQEGRGMEGGTQEGTRHEGGRDAARRWEGCGMREVSKGKNNKNKNEKLTEARIGACGWCRRRAVHRGDNARSETRVSKGKTTKKKNLLGADRGCSGCCITAAAQSGQVRDTGKRVSAREKITMQIERKDLPGRVLAGDVGGGADEQ